MASIALDGESLSLEKFYSILDGEKVTLDPKAKHKIQESRNHVEKLTRSGNRVYSINTGFGILSDVSIEPKDLETLQVNLVRSHCCNVGPIHTEEESRAILLLRANALATGFSGVRLELVEFLISLLNTKVHPVIPTKGSVGASGDLSPLAHLASVIIGEGEALYKGKRMPGDSALKAAGLTPLVLASKEGLSLINGTQQMAGLGAVLLRTALDLVDLADIITACTVDGILGSPSAFKHWVHEARPHSGQIRSASRIFNALQGSEISASHASCAKIQDAYSLRCAPQVHGACRDLLDHVQRVLEIEFNSATDNPLIHWKTGEVAHQGNFHGQPVAFALDILGMAASEIASISERRIVKLINPIFSQLPTFLVEKEGLNSGFMVAQYTAASLVAESRGLTFSASCDSIPTCNEKEDHVSMGPNAARKAKTILENSQAVLAIECLASCQALEFRKPLKPGKPALGLYNAVRKHVPKLDQDRPLHKDVQKVVELFQDRSFIQKLRGEQII